MCVAMGVKAIAGRSRLAGVDPGLHFGGLEPSRH